jgi:hypothetical protein
MKDKKGLQFKSALFALVTVSIAIIAVGFWIDDWNVKYDSGLTYDLGGYNKLDTMSDYASSSKGSLAVKSSSDTTGSGDFEGTSIRGAFSIINNLFTPFNVVFGAGGLIDSIQERWGIPNYIIIGLITLMIIAIIYSIIALFFKKSTPA